VYSKEFIDFLITRATSPEIEAASRLGQEMLSGSFGVGPATARIETHVSTLPPHRGVLETSSRQPPRRADYFLARQNIMVWA